MSINLLSMTLKDIHDTCFQFYSGQVLSDQSGGDSTARYSASSSNPVLTEGGIVLVGLLLEGAAWDSYSECLTESTPGQLTSPCPPVRLVPRLRSAQTRSGASPVYLCPVYRTSTRKVSSIDTGGFVISIELPVRPPLLTARTTGSFMTTGRKPLGLTVQTGSVGNMRAPGMNRRPSLPQVDQVLQSSHMPLSAIGSVSDDTAYVLRGAACVCNADE